MSLTPAQEAGLLMSSLASSMLRTADPAVKADLRTSMADARTALCLATGVPLDDIHPAAGYDLTFAAYERVREPWLALDLTSWHAARDCARAGEYWRRVRPEYLDKLPWPGTEQGLTAEDRAEIARDIQMDRRCGDL